MTDYFYQLLGSRRVPDDADRQAQADPRDSAHPPGDEAYWAEAAAEPAEGEPLWYEDRLQASSSPRALPLHPQETWNEPSGLADDDPAADPGDGEWSDEAAFVDTAAEDYPDEAFDEDDGAAALPVPSGQRAYVPGGQAASARAAAAAGERNIRFDPTKERGVAYYDAAARHSRNVRLLKIGLPTIAVLSIVGFFLFMTLGEKGDGLPALTLSGINLDTREITMDKPHISGFDGTKQSYEVTAATAVQQLGNPKVVALETIDARFAVAEDVRAKVLAKAGVYDADTQKLQLDGGIDITTDNGYTGRLEKADVDIGQGTVFSDTGVALHGKEGQITADGIEVLDRGKHIFFRGNVKVRYAPPEEAEPDKAGDAAGAAPATTPATTETVSDGST